WYSSWLTMKAGRLAQRAEGLIKNFRPTAVLTVAFGYSWISAARFAAKHDLPLHLICHDDWPRHTKIVHWLKNCPDVVFGQIYQQAASRLCVSPYMCETYRERYGSIGTVLYPSR